MARFVYTDINLYSKALSLSKSADCVVITASQTAARALDVPHQNLTTFATTRLRKTGWEIASPLKAQSVFRQVLQDVVQPVNLLGTTNAWLPTVRALLQSSPNLELAPSKVSTRTAQLFQVAQAFQQALHERKLVDLSELYWQTLVQPIKQQKVLIYGYFQPRQDELALINVLASLDSIMFLPAPNIPLFIEVLDSVNWLAEKGWKVVTDLAPDQVIGEHLSKIFTGYKSWIPDKEPGYSGCFTAHCYSTFEAEVRGTLAQVKSLLNKGTLAREIVIVARDEVAYGPKLIDIAWEYGVPLRVLFDTPLLSTRLGAWLISLMDLIDTGWPFEETAKLLSHPLCSNPDQDFWATVRVQHPVGFKAWKESAQNLLNLNLSALTHVNQERRRDTWSVWWQELFKVFDLRKRCARWSRESIAFNTLHQGLVELSKPETEKLTWSEMRQEFQDLLAVLNVPAQPGRGGVELHKPTSVIGARYSCVFVLGMAEGVLPAAISNDPVLDFFERQHLQTQGIALASAAELACQEALLFYDLLQTVVLNVTFSYAKIKDRQEQLPSPYLKQLGLKVTEPPTQPIASPEELRRAGNGLRYTPILEDAVLPHAAHALKVEQHRESSETPNEYDGVIGIPLDYADWRFSVSQLRDLGQCPFKWFAANLLKLRPPEEIEEDLSPSQIGQLYHKVLELILADVLQNPTTKIADFGVLEEKFAIAEQGNIPINLPTWELRRQEHLRYLTLAIQNPDFLPEGAMPVLLEGKFSGNWYGLKVVGRIDRIDRTDHGLVLIDYKTGKSRPAGIKDQNGKACIDLQLSLYKEAAGPALFPDEPIASAYYYSIRGRQIISTSSRAPQHELPDAIDRCKAHLRNGQYPVQPDNAKSACTYCNFDALCRQGDRLSRKSSYPLNSSPTMVEGELEDLG